MAQGLSRPCSSRPALRSLAALTAAAILSTAGTSAQAQTCTATSTAVTAVNPTDAAALAGDCTALLGVKDTLRGTATLNWENTLSMASWTGISLTSDRNRVSQLRLPADDLTGSIPDLSALTSLTSLHLSATKLTGSINPAHFPNSLTQLYLNENDLTGSIPDLSALTSLTTLGLFSTKLSGSVDPAHFPNSLTQLSLQDNELSGSFPDLSALTSLTALRLDDNDLTGSIPDLSALTSLTTLYAEFNRLSGSIVAAHFPASLEVLLLQENELSGSIPDLSALTSLTALYIHGNELTGSVPDLSALTSLTQFWAHRNSLSGSIDAAHFPSSLRLLLLFGNDLTGSIPNLSALTSLTHLYIHGNDLSGAIPTTLPTSLVGLHLSGNPKLSGGIPGELGNLTSLTDLSLCETGLTASATLPSALETRRSADSLTVRSCLSIEDAEGPEGTTLTFDVMLSTWPVRGSATSTVHYTTGDGTATSADYAAGTGSATIPAVTAPETATTTTIEVAAHRDRVVEDDETFTLTLSVPSDRTSEVVQLRSVATGTISNAAPPPDPDPQPDPGPPPPPSEPPTGGTVGGATVTLGFRQSLDTSSVPDASDFTVTSTSSSAASASSSPNEPASVAARQTLHHTVTAVRIEGASVLLTVSPRIPAGASVRVSYTKGAKPLRTEAGAELDSFGLTVFGGSPVCPSRLAPYWHGTGGFAVRPTDGESAMVRIECGGKSHASREYAGEDGLIVRTVSQPMCTTEDGRVIEGEMTFEGIDGDGWYWVNGDRNVAVAPLACASQLNPELRPPVPGGVTARPAGDRRFVLSVRGMWHGTLMVHDESGFMGIVPHLVDLEGDGEHVAPYWKGGGGIVGRPLDGSRATVRLACGEADAESHPLDASEDGGLIVELLRGCFDEDGVAVSGRLEVDGLEDGAWYWLNIDGAASAAPLVRRGANVDLTTPVLPAGMETDEGPLGTLFSRGPLMGVVPRLERADN